MEFRL